jgi:signal transduction histidine kinase
LRLSQGLLALLVALTIILGLSLSSATVEQQRLLSEFTAETRQQVHASAEALSRLDSIGKDMRMLADLVDRSRRPIHSEDAMERGVWESAFRALAVVVVHYRIIALVAADGSLSVVATDPTEDPATARILMPRVAQLGVAAAGKGAEKLAGESPFAGRSFLLYATPVPSGGAIVVASDAALLLRSVAWPQVPSGRLFVTDPSGVVWSGCEAARGCQIADTRVVPRNLGASTRAPFRVDARQAERLGLFAAEAIWVSENVARPIGSWTVTWVASMEPILRREQSTLFRIAGTALAATIVVALIGIVLMRQQHRADELASQLVYAKAEAKAHELENQLVRADRLVTVGVMATEIAHEIGTPLGVVRGRAEQVLPRLGDGAGAEDLRVVIKQVDHISSTIRQLLDFSRRSPVEKRAISLETVVERTRELLQVKLGARGLQLDLDLNADLPQLTADPDQLQQVLVNLLLNACDASRAGDRLSISARSAPKEMVLIEVSDPGCGISPENLKSIFEPFFTTKPRGEGTGLGLPIAVGIVRNHGGQIDVRSNPGRGTTVTVLWPASAPLRPTDG